MKFLLVILAMRLVTALIMSSRKCKSEIMEDLANNCVRHPAEHELR